MCVQREVERRLEIFRVLQQNEAKLLKRWRKREKREREKEEEGEGELDRKFEFMSL